MVKKHKGIGILKKAENILDNTAISLTAIFLKKKDVNLY